MLLHDGEGVGTSQAAPGNCKGPVIIARGDDSCLASRVPALPGRAFSNLRGPKVESHYGLEGRKGGIHDGGGTPEGGDGRHAGNERC